MEELVSIIVPIYNVEKYLNKCIDSILNQTYKNLEIILVDDNSPDNCPKICDEYAKQDTRIKVIHKENGGLSSARNAGLDICTGEYIAFVDSDDYVEKDYILDLYKTIKDSNADISVCGFNKIDLYTNKIIGVYQDKKFLYDDTTKFEFLFRDDHVTSVVAWNKLYRKEIFNNLKYPEGHIHEDEYIVYDLIKNTKNGIATTENVLYNYIIRNDSITGNQKITKKNFDAFYCLEHRLQKMDNHSKYYGMVVEQYFHSMLTMLIRTRKNKELYDLVLQEFKLKYKGYKKYIIKLKLKVFYNLLLVMPKLAILIARKLKRIR